MFLRLIKENTCEKCVYKRLLHRKTKNNATHLEPAENYWKLYLGNFRSEYQDSLWSKNLSIITMIKQQQQQKKEHISNSATESF